MKKLGEIQRQSSGLMKDQRSLKAPFLSFTQDSRSFSRRVKKVQYERSVSSTVLTVLRYT